MQVTPGPRDVAEARELAELRRALWTQPILADAEIPVTLEVPYSSWQLQKSRGDCPKLFKIGRRVFVRTSDLRAWLDNKAAQAA